MNKFKLPSDNFATYQTKLNVCTARPVLTLNTAPKAYLFVVGKLDEHGYDLRLEVVRADRLGELAQFAGGGAAHHRRIVLAQVTEVHP